MTHPEYTLQKQVCEYIRLQYHDLLFMSDTIAAVKLKPQQAVRNAAIQKRGFKCPDLIIFEPRGQYHGLLIELKIETPYKKNGEIKASQNDHLKQQYETLIELNRKGYRAEFAWSFEMAKGIIDEYLK